LYRALSHVQHVSFCRNCCICGIKSTKSIAQSRHLNSNTSSITLNILWVCAIDYKKALVPKMIRKSQSNCWNAIVHLIINKWMKILNTLIKWCSYNKIISHTSVLIFRHWLFTVFECTVREKHCLLIVACWYAFISAWYLGVSAWVSCSSDPVNITKPLDATTCFSAMKGFLQYPLSRWRLLPAQASYHNEPVVTTAVSYNTIIIANFKWYLQLTELNRGNQQILFMEIIQTN